MAKLGAVDCTDQKHWHALAEAFLEPRLGVDVDLRDSCAGRLGERSERRPHVIAQMTIRADEERELGHPGGRLRYSPFPSFSVV